MLLLSEPPGVVCSVSSFPSLFVVLLGELPGVICSASFLHGLPPWQWLVHGLPLMKQPHRLDEQPFWHEQLSHSICYKGSASLKPYVE